MKKKKRKKRKKKSEGEVFGMDKAVSKKPCQAKGHSIRGWLRLRDAVLGRIVQELSLLSLEARRKVLQQSFSQAQRVALEQWMLSHRTPRKTSLRRPCARCKAAEARTTKPWGAPKAKSAAGLLKIKGVVSSRSSGQSSYYAVACLGMLRFTSRKTRDLWSAVGYYEDLIRLLQRVRSWTWGSLEERLLCAVTEALPSMKAMDLHLAVRFRLQRWVAQPLSSPTFVATNQVSLRRGLHAWRRLHTAREALRSTERAGPPSLSEERSWQILRSTFLDVEVEAGMSRQLREERLAQAEQSRAAHRQRLLERWNQQCMAEEDHWAQVERKRERAFFARGSRLLSKLEQAEQGLCKAQAAHGAASEKFHPGAPEPCKRRRVGPKPLAGRRGTVRDPSATLELWRSG